MKNKEISLAFALIFVIVVTACAQQYDSENDFRATPIDNGRSVEITEYIGSKWTVRIPPRIQDLPVTHIGNGAFRNKNIVNVTIPNSVTHIGNSAFSTNQFTNINIPASVTSIGSAAFDSNSLTAINVSTGNSVYISENGVLYNKNKTTLYRYPQGKTDNSFVIPSSVINIANSAFEGCIHLTQLIIPNSVSSIGDYAFYGCIGLAENIFDVIRPLAVIMGDYHLITAEQRRDRFDEILLNTITSQPNIINIFSVWKPNALDIMDRNFIGRAGSTTTGQYAMTYSRNNNQILIENNQNVGELFAYIIGPNARQEWIEHTFFNVNGQNTFLLRIIVPIIDTRTSEVVGIVGCEFDIR